MPSIIPGVSPDKSFDVAVRSLDMEIELFWKRWNFHWICVAAAFGAYMLVKKEQPHLGMLIAAFGLVSSIAWLLGSIGSRWWIKNWEAKVAAEARALGIHEVFATISEEESVMLWLPKARYSTTRLAILLSAFVSVLWAIVFAKGYFDSGRDVKSLAIVFVAAFFVVLFLTLARGGNRTAPKTKPEDRIG